VAKKSAKKESAAAAALTAGMLAMLAAPASASEFGSISKSSKAGPQVVEHDAGTFVVKCVGAAKGGENDCGALDGSHACAGQSAAGDDYSENEWVYLTLQQCAEHPSGKFLMKGENGPMVMGKKEFQFKLVKK